MSIETQALSYSLTTIEALTVSCVALTRDAKFMTDRLNAQFELIEQLRSDVKMLRGRVTHLELQSAGETA